MADKSRVEVRIAGKEYILVGPATDEYIQKIALYVDKKMNEIMKANHKLSTSMAAVLTALNVADDYFKSLENSENLERKLKRAQEHLEILKDENENLSGENAVLSEENTSLKLELAKREAELRELRNSLDILTRP
ncbi:MAG TPA: cell division protein ZapA [Clostridiaceae bacterium]|nr:cell division protein ZapA [Clostridiaceae bacterium]